MLLFYKAFASDFIFLLSWKIMASIVKTISELVISLIKALKNDMLRNNFTRHSKVWNEETSLFLLQEIFSQTILVTNNNNSSVSALSKTVRYSWCLGLWVL